MKRRPGSNRRGIRLPTSPPATGGGGGGGIVTDGLVLHLDASNGASYPGTGTVWTDLIDPSKSVTFSGDPTFVADPGYLNLQGNNIANGTNANIASIAEGAIEVWFRWKANSAQASGTLLSTGGNWYHLGHAAGGGYAEAFEFYNNSGLAMQYVDTGGNTHLKDSQWHQLVVVVTGGGAPDPNTIYLDGNVIPPISGGVGLEYRIGSSSTTTLWNNAALYIGALGGSLPYNNDIAIVRMYDRSAGGDPSFSAAEVAQNYAAESTKFAAWKPDHIASLTLWVDPNDSSTVTTAAGGEITEIFDKAHAIDRASFKAPSGSPNGPTIVTDGGVNWMQFTHSGGVSDELHGKKVAGANNLIRSDTFSSNNYEAHIVVKVNSMPTTTSTQPWNTNLIGPSDSSGYWGFYARNDGSSSPGPVAEITPYNYSSNSTYTRYPVNLGDKHILGHSKSAGTSDLFNYLDGASTLVGNFGSTLSGGSGQLRFGAASGTGSEFEGQIGEVLIFNEELSASDRNDVITYLKAKWGIT